MIRVTEAEFSTSDIYSIKEQIEFLESKVAENHWPKIAVRTGLVLVAVAVVFALTRSPLWSGLIFIPGAFWAAAPIGSITTQRMQRDWLKHEQGRLETPRKFEICVDDCEYLEFSEYEDEGVLYLFCGNNGNWLMLEGQNYYPTESFPSASFRLAYDSHGALLNIASALPWSPPKHKYDAETKIARNLTLGTIDHAIVIADNEEAAIAQFQSLATEKSK